MTIFVNERMVGAIKTDEILSKRNYRSTKGCSIDDLILENALLHDCSINNVEQKVHNFACL